MKVIVQNLNVDSQLVNWDLNEIINSLLQNKLEYEQ